MVVVPTLAVTEEADKHVVPAALRSGVVAIAPQMGDRIDRPGLVPDDDGAHEHAPYQQAGAQLDRRQHRSSYGQLGDEAGDEKRRPRSEDDQRLPEWPLQPLVEALAQQVASIALEDAEPVELAVFDDDPANVCP